MHLQYADSVRNQPKFFQADTSALDLLWKERFEGISRFYIFLFLPAVPAHRGLSGAAADNGSTVPLCLRLTQESSQSSLQIFMLSRCSYGSCNELNSDSIKFKEHFCVGQSSSDLHKISTLLPLTWVLSFNYCKSVLTIENIVGNYMVLSQAYKHWITAVLTS